MNTFKYLGATLAENGDLDVDLDVYKYNQDEQTGRGYRGFCATEE